MNLPRLAAARNAARLLFAALAVGLAIAPVRAVADESHDDALAAARAWLAQIDAGNFRESYDAGCRAFQNKVTSNEWTTVLTAVRPAFGKLVSRKENSHTYHPDGLEGLDGECMEIIYDANYDKIGPVMEVVVLKREDGKWRGAGYDAQPQLQGP